MAGSTFAPTTVKAVSTLVLTRIQHKEGVSCLLTDIVDMSSAVKLNCLNVEISQVCSLFPDVMHFRCSFQQHDISG